MLRSSPCCFVGLNCSKIIAYFSNKTLKHFYLIWIVAHYSGWCGTRNRNWKIIYNEHWFHLEFLPDTETEGFKVVSEVDLGLLAFASPVGRGCWIRRQYLCREVTHPLNECSGYDIKPSDGEASILELRGTKCTSSLPLLPDALWYGASVCAIFSSLYQIGQLNYLNHLKMLGLYQTTWWLLDNTPFVENKLLIQPNPAVYWSERNEIINSITSNHICTNNK